MKTYKMLVDWLGWNTPEVAPIATPQAVDDVDNAAFSVEQPDNLDKLNAYCSEINNKQYINPYYPLNTLWRKLSIIGLNFDIKSILFNGGTQGNVQVPLNQYGGRYGTLGGPEYISQDDGISKRLPGGLNLAVHYQNNGGIYSLNVAIVRGVDPAPFVESETPVKKK